MPSLRALAWKLPSEQSSSHVLFFFLKSLRESDGERERIIRSFGSIVYCCKVFLKGSFKTSLAAEIRKKKKKERLVSHNDQSVTTDRNDASTRWVNRNCKVRRLKWRNHPINRQMITDGSHEYKSVTGLTFVLQYTENTLRIFGSFQILQFTAGILNPSFFFCHRLAIVAVIPVDLKDKCQPIVLQKLKTLLANWTWMLPMRDHETWVVKTSGKSHFLFPGVTLGQI